ncbi:MAG TPA: hypothetical protein VNT55_15010, partial [Baekduia sp.]|nr:hypothetical protein [Baekduia sp.]
LGADGTSLLGGVQQSGSGRQAFVAAGRAGAAPSQVTPLGGSGVITTPPVVAVDDAGHGAVVFARDKTVFLSRCSAGRCSAPASVGTSAVLPQPALALQPGSGRITVLWRGRTRSHVSRLQWRITTNGKLGRVHTLGELGDQPQLGTDASGKSVAIWLGHGTNGGLRTAARRVGEMTRPTRLFPGRVALPRLVTGAGGETIAAWISAANLDVQSLSAQALFATRTPNRAFSTPLVVGGPDTGALALDRAPDGHAVLALDRQVDATDAIPEAAVRAPHGPFGAPQPLAGAQFIPTPFGPAASIDDRGTATVAWASGAMPPGLPVTPDGFFAARGDAGAAFGPPQQLTADATTGNQQHPVTAAAGTRTLVAWTTPAGAFVATAG